ncbi:MAG TPA: gas vesicle protein [Thermoanaerobaculia bacterium]|nr:gas vesicle protein [Thermoanaerobaculia bacterium]
MNRPVHNSSFIVHRSSFLSHMPDQTEDLSVLEALDHLLDRGVVIAGEAVISIGDVDLLYLGLNVVLANVDAVIRVSSGKK